MLPYKLTFRRFFVKMLRAAGQYGSVIDIACADGKLRSFFEGYSYTGIDMSLEAIENAKKKYPQDTFILMKLPSPETRNLGSFDLVVSTHTFAHFADVDKQLLFHQLLSISKPNSRIILQLTSHDWFQIRGEVSEHCHVLECKTYRGAFSNLLENFNRLNTTKFGFYLSNVLSFVDWGKKEVLLLLTPRMKK